MREGCQPHGPGPAPGARRARWPSRRARARARAAGAAQHGGPSGTTRRRRAARRGWRQQPRQRREQRAADPCSGSSARSRATRQRGSTALSSTPARRRRPPGRVADHDQRRRLERCQQRSDALRPSAGKDEPGAARQRVKAWPGKSGAITSCRLGQQRRQVTPRMRGGAGAVQQQYDGRRPAVHRPSHRPPTDRSGARRRAQRCTCQRQPPAATKWLDSACGQHAASRRVQGCERVMWWASWRVLARNRRRRRLQRRRGAHVASWRTAADNRCGANVRG